MHLFVHPDSEQPAKYLDFTAKKSKMKSLVYIFTEKSIKFLAKSNRIYDPESFKKYPFFVN